MTERVEQQYCIKFCQKLRDSEVETIRKIQQAFSNDAMGATHIKEWINCFKDDCTLADSDQRSGRPSTSRNANVIENVRSLILEDHRLTHRHRKHLMRLLLLKLVHQSLHSNGRSADNSKPIIASLPSNEQQTFMLLFMLVL
jgi:hypothetical protein